jgi:hypothetical protein
MLPGGLLVLLTALVLWGLWSVARPRAAFVVQMVRGEVRVARGTVTPGFVRDVREVCAHNKVEDGEVRGVARDDHIVLEFSDGIPAACRQQLRNLWMISGWSTGKRRKSAP